MKLPSKSLKTNRREYIPHREAGPRSALPQGKYWGHVFEGWNWMNARKSLALQEASAVCSPGAQLCWGCGKLSGDFPMFLGWIPL